MRLYNSLTRAVEEFKPIHNKTVGMYACGPTVYDYVHIGNMRTYVLVDLVYRTLRHEGFKVSSVMNITDVGHLTGDNLGDASTGEDRLVKQAMREKKTAWDVARFYTDAFFEDFKTLNLVPPKFVKATEHIADQIALIKKLEEKGYTYRTSDGIYFNTAKFPEYGKLSTLDKIKEGARVEPNPEKKNPRDFALWKFSPIGHSRDMEWDSPWGKGFPGWHIECSAMSMKYLGETFDIHLGGEDLRSTHHPNEMAESEAVTGKPLAHIWVHGAFLLVNGGRMGKSLGNAYTVKDIIKHGYDPLALKYLFYGAHYRTKLNFTWESLEAAQSALTKIRSFMARVSESVQKKVKSEETEYKNKFFAAFENDLNTSEALSVIWDVLKSPLSDQEKYNHLMAFDEVFGLDFGRVEKINIPDNVQSKILEREKARSQKDWKRADEIRAEVLKLGYEVLDTPDGPDIKPIQ
ncbi:cysteine--tRNA ligase [Candidatus Parcubacteria bacterium]|nr:cysteine--tRNA ligase [Candidatus Parcubacteria bacterium]